MTGKNRYHSNIRRKRTSVLIGLCLMIQFFAGAGVLRCQAKEIQEPENLYARAAVLMDADSGRVLFAKNGQEERAMASTTKIMTCILALEHGGLDETVTASANAAGQPEVRLGVREGQQFRMRDLLYSLMLESHNDAAVIIAEAVGKSVEGFADMMNAKAEELDCNHTYFITPNGLDGEDENGTHHTTAEDLARIMKYCIMDSPQKELFLEITRTPNYQFTDVTGERSYSCNNHNAFLQMMSGALSGKTGFTSEAGYCYVGALESEGRTFIAALLACGWPNNKGYKWADMRKLMSYGMEHFHYKTLEQKLLLKPVEVAGGIPDGNVLNGKSYVALEMRVPENITMPIRELLRDDEEICMEYMAVEHLNAPVEKGEEAGEVRIMLEDEEVYTFPIVTTEDVLQRDFLWCFKQVKERFLL